MRHSLSLLGLATTVAAHGVHAAYNETALYSCISKVFTTDAAQRIVRPSDDTYLDARMGEKIQFEELPLMIAYAEAAEEIAPLIKCAQTAGIKAVPRTGGHSFTSFSSLNGTLVIDIAHINYVNVSKDAATAVVGAGIRLGALYTALDPYNTTFIGGICPTVGLAGYIGSGGFNMQQRGQGLAVEHVLSAKVVTADGNLLVASASENPDLFWAIRGGGGGTYGIVVEFTLALTQLPRSAMVLLSWNDTSSRYPVARQFLDWAPNQVPQFTSQVNVYKNTVQVLGWYYGATAEQLKTLVSSSGLLNISNPDVIISGGCDVDNARVFGYTTTECVADDTLDASILNVVPDPFSQYQTSPQFQWEETTKSTTEAQASPWTRFRRMSKSFFVQKSKPITDTVLKSVVDQIGQVDDDSQVWGEWHAWNLAPRTQGTESAFAWREEAYAHFEFQIHGSTNQTQQTAYDNWFANLESFLRPALGQASYSGYMDTGISTNPLTSYYGGNVCKLISVKKKFDPEEFFTNPFSIPASAPQGITC